MEKLEGKSILCVEDEPLIAMTLAIFLEQAGCVGLGPARNVDQSLKILNGPHIDAAILDINLGAGETSAPVADALRLRRIPFFFATGYGAAGLRAVDQTVPRLDKPYSAQEIYLHLHRCFDT